MLQYFILPSVESLLIKMWYIFLVVVLLKACDVISNGHHLCRHLGFYQDLEIRLKP